ncbi:hypothetical protein [Marinomonas sp. IMCC 4694]|uniref:hypothetical protein n=1 Tax=Marinomonas sp. IMCC 4694 TaxID=2605432 RepID=UPI0011E89ECC|nr:hypothetical protein [Marinomonas sp. IMCC 4694]TYL48612.1 hypothetical protein FXV75_12050 [Marinomonas sp. IMCC 4694]
MVKLFILTAAYYSGNKMMVLSEYFVKMAGILPELSLIKTRQISGGFSNAVYLIYVNQVPHCVLRIPALNEEAFGINRAHEMRVIEAAAKASISPNILWKDEKGAFAAEFVPQPSLDWGVCHCDADLV